MSLINALFRPRNTLPPRSNMSDIFTGLDMRGPSSVEIPPNLQGRRWRHVPPQPDPRDTSGLVLRQLDPRSRVQRRLDANLWDTVEFNRQLAGVSRQLHEVLAEVRSAHDWLDTDDAAALEQVADWLPTLDGTRYAGMLLARVPSLHELGLPEEHDDGTALLYGYALLSA